MPENAEVTLAEKEAALAAELGTAPNSQERLARVVARGRRQAPLPPESRRDEFLVEGCLAKLWFVPSFRGGRCFFESDSDSAIVKGIAALLCEFYSGQLPGEILRGDGSFLAKLGVTAHLSPNRRNGLGRLMEKMRAFASGCIGSPPLKS
jgi:cysteine desulfuration protein SufE